MKSSLVFVGAAFPRTGTMSVKAALEKLRLGAAYHMHEVFMNPAHIPVWEKAYGDPGSVDWHSLLDGYCATLDGPACLFWKELAEAYPNSKILLLKREAFRKRSGLG